MFFRISIFVLLTTRFYFAITESITTDVSTTADDPTMCQVGAMYNISSKLDLRRCLLANYFKHDAPLNTSVTIATAPLNLLLVDDHDERINLVFDVKLSWRDERMQWQQQNSSTIDPIHSVEQLPDEIWLPTVEVVNRLRSRTDFMMQWIHVATDSDGTTRAHGQFLDDISCKMDAYYYPFDTQRCPLLIAFLYGARPDLSFEMSAVSTQLNSSMYLNRFGMDRVGEWRMECCGHLEIVPFERNKLYVVIYTIQLKRSWVQPLMTWIFPPIVISMAGVVSLYFGCKPAEHHSFGASIVITMTLLLTGLYARLPASGTGFPIIGQLYLGLSLSILVSMSLSTLRFERNGPAAASSATAAALPKPSRSTRMASRRRNSYVARGLLKLYLTVSRRTVLSRAELEYRIKLSCVVLTLMFNVVTVAYVFSRWLLAYI